MCVCLCVYMVAQSSAFMCTFAVWLCESVRKAECLTYFTGGTCKMLPLNNSADGQWCLFQVKSHIKIINIPVSINLFCIWHLDCICTVTGHPDALVKLKYGVLTKHNFLSCDLQSWFARFMTSMQDMTVTWSRQTTLFVHWFAMKKQRK